MKNEQHDDRYTVEPLGGGRLAEFMTVEDVADMLRINKSTVYRMAKGGRLPATRVGRQWRFRLSALEKLLDAGGDLAFEQNQEEGLKKVANRW